jgi:glucose/mannose-6-phosphate isomerase
MINYKQIIYKSYSNNKHFGKYMLDDLKFIHTRDAQDTLGIAEKQWQQLNENFDIPTIDGPISNVVYAGMGGSALAAVVSSSWPEYKVPFEVVRNYSIPGYVSDKTIFIAASYSGNTEETLSALEEAEKRSAKILIIAGGGKLLEIAKEKGYPVSILPAVEQPRYGVLYNLKALVSMLSGTGVLKVDNAAEQLVQAIDFLKEATQKWRADIPTSNNYAKQIALELMGKSVVVYAGPQLFPAAYKWKINFNENAKHIAWLNQFPEFNHNEILGWTKQPVDKPYAVVDLRSKLEHPRVQKRFIVTEKLLSGLRPSPIVVNTEGSTILEQLLWTIALGDFVSLYLALLSNLNPAPVDLITKLKEELNS